MGYAKEKTIYDDGLQTWVSFFSRQTLLRHHIGKTMKPNSALIALLALTLLSLSSIAGTPADHPPMEQASTKVGSNPLLTQKAKVLNVVDVRNYTYLEVAMDKEEATNPIWLAGPTTVVKVGNTVRFDEGMQMVDFHSDSLNRNFANLLLVSHIEVIGEQ